MIIDRRTIIGGISVCGRGYPGVARDLMVRQKDGTTKPTYVGFSLSPGWIGLPWQSQHPRLLISAEELQLMAAGTIPTYQELGKLGLQRVLDQLGAQNIPENEWHILGGRVKRVGGELVFENLVVEKAP